MENSAIKSLGLLHQEFPKSPTSCSLFRLESRRVGVGEFVYSLHNTNQRRRRRMDLSKSAGIEGKKFVVTGGLGHVGSALCLELLRREASEVRSLDCRTSSPWSRLLSDHGVFCIYGDITSQNDISNALKGADCVFHLASYGLSGKQMLQVSRVDGVNINGTSHIIEACVEFGVARLVYVSTYNVVFGGNEIINGDETLPLFPIDEHVDSYGRSKSIAEQLVLKSNGRPLREKNGKCLYTCAIRPAAIYGPGEERHLPNTIRLAKLGLLAFKIGHPDVKSDWVYVDNLVHALILASMGLLDDIPGRERPPVAAGQPYFISDGSPVNSFEFLRPLLESLEYEMPKASLPVPQALFLGRIFSFFYTMILYPWLNKWWIPQPLILPTEVYKVGVTHYFSLEKAKQELGYVPIVSAKEGMDATISYWQDIKRKSLDGPTLFAWLFCIIGMVSLFAVAYFPLPDFGPFNMLRAFCLLCFGSAQTVRVVFLVSAALHVGEAVYAWFLARKVDPANARGWFWQTLTLGIFSLCFLLKRARTNPY